jgi:hypothetical protein
MGSIKNIGEDLEGIGVQELDEFTIKLRINFALYD